MSVSLSENQAFFAASRDEIAESAPGDAAFVVIADREVIGYFATLTDALAEWGARGDAIVEELKFAPPALVASNFRAHV